MEIEPAEARGESVEAIVRVNAWREAAQLPKGAHALTVLPLEHGFENDALHVGATLAMLSRSSGGMSSAPVSWRISSTSSVPIPTGQRRAHSMASSRELTSMR
mgnify:CR=1 FL=1